MLVIEASLPLNLRKKLGLFYSEMSHEVPYDRKSSGTQNNREGPRRELW
jgi:hypothetical protein